MGHHQQVEGSRVCGIVALKIVFRLVDISLQLRGEEHVGHEVVGVCSSDVLVVAHSNGKGGGEGGSVGGCGLYPHLYRREGLVMSACCSHDDVPSLDAIGYEEVSLGKDLSF